MLWACLIFSSTNRSTGPSIPEPSSLASFNVRPLLQNEHVLIKVALFYKPNPYDFNPVSK